MLKKLFPRNESFFDLFDRLTETIRSGAVALAEMLEAPPREFGSWAAKIKAIESQADDIARETIDELHRSFVSPLDREDINRLVYRLDDILDRIEEAAARLFLYEVGEVTQTAKAFARILVASTAEVRTAVGGLREMSKPGVIRKSCAEIDRLEDEADDVLRESLARLFHEDIDMRDLIKWKEIYEMLESATDCCKFVAGVIEGILVEHA